MPGIYIRDGDSFEAALKKFKKQCEKAGILSEIRKREAYEKPSVKKKKKAVAARKRLVKKAAGGGRSSPRGESSGGMGGNSSGGSGGGRQY